MNRDTANKLWYVYLRLTDCQLAGLPPPNNITELILELYHKYYELDKKPEE